VAKLTKAVIPDPGYPWQPGHEIVAHDVTAGPVSDEPAGPPVTVNPLVYCRECARCRAGEVNLCASLRMVGWHLPGAFAEYLVVRRRTVVAVPPGLPPDRAVLAEPTAVAVHGVRCGVHSRPPGQLAVVGSGTLAVASAAYAASLGWRVSLLARDP